MSDNNLKLWKLVDETPKEYVKEVKFGRKFNAIDPYYRIREATKLFGTFGNQWGVKNAKFEFQNDLNLIIYTAEMWYSFKTDDLETQGVFPIQSSARLKNKEGKTDEDCVKKVATDALTKGLSMLGFSADVFMGEFVDEKYTNRDGYDPSPKKAPFTKKKTGLPKHQEELLKSSGLTEAGINAKLKKLYKEGKTGKRQLKLSDLTVEQVKALENRRLI